MRRPEEAEMPRILFRASTALVVATVAAGLAIRAMGGRTGFEERIQPIFLSGAIGRVIARSYAPFNRRLYAAVARILELQPEDEVLDVACGSGVFLRDYAAHARRIAGLDQSEPMIEEALRQNGERVKAGTAEFVVGDAASLPWESDAFTVVTSNCVDCYESKARIAIGEMYRVLKPGGRALLGDDRRDAMEAAGFRRVTTQPILWGVATTGHKE
jgi:SAM-dependent methyltransferase